MVRLDEPSIAAFSIFGVDPQSVQYIILFKENHYLSVSSLQIQAFLLVPHYQGRNVLSGEKQGETAVFAGYSVSRKMLFIDRY